MRRTDEPCAGDPDEDRAPSADEASDETLARRVQAGDADAFETLLRRYLRPVHAVTASYLAEEADVEDAVQDTFLRALGGIGGYEPTRPFAPWLYQIARNVARNRLAGQERRSTEPLGETVPASSSPNPEAELERAELRGLVERAIDRLPEQRRTAFRLVEVDGYATAEVARLMGLTAGTVRAHVHHARRSLREALARPTGRGESNGEPASTGREELKR